MELRSRRRSTADQEKLVSSVSDYFDRGGGIFVQCKLQTEQDDDWEDDTHLIFAQNGPNRFTLQVQDGAHAELQLLCNANFPVQPTRSCDSGCERLIDVPGLPSGIGRPTVKTYYDLFYLTPKDGPNGTLGALEGPATWTFDAIFDPASDTLSLAATGRREEKPPFQSLLKLPLHVIRQSATQQWGVISVHWEEMEKVMPGIIQAQKPYVAGITGITGVETARRARGKKNRLAPAKAAPDGDHTDSDDEPLISRFSPNSRRKLLVATIRQAPAVKASKSRSDSDSDDRPLVKRARRAQPGIHNGPPGAAVHTTSSTLLGQEVPAHRSEARPTQVATTTAITTSTTSTTTTTTAAASTSSQTAHATVSPSAATGIQSELGSIASGYTSTSTSTSTSPEPEDCIHAAPSFSSNRVADLGLADDSSDDGSDSSSESSDQPDDYYNGTWRSILRRPIQMNRAAFVDRTPLPRYPESWHSRYRRPVLRRRDGPDGPSPVITIPYNPYRDHPVVVNLRGERGGGAEGRLISIFRAALAMPEQEAPTLNGRDGDGTTAAGDSADAAEENVRLSKDALEMEEGAKAARTKPREEYSEGKRDEVLFLQNPGIEPAQASLSERTKDHERTLPSLPSLRPIIELAHRSHDEITGYADLPCHEGA